MGDTTDQVITPIRKVDARFSHAGDYTTNKIYCGKYSGRAGEVDLCGIIYAQLMPEWRNGRRSGLKIRRRVSVVRVRVPSPACQLTLSASWSGGARGVNALLVFVGGGIGSLLRHGAQLAIGAYAFPVATLVVNVAGSFLIGCLGGFGMRFAWREYACLFLMTGLCGGFTTFSTFSRESLGLLQSGAYGSFALYAMGSVALGIAASALGFWIAR